MTKHAIEGLTDSLAAQLAPLGVRVSVVEPGNYRSNMDNNMLARLPEDARAKVIKASGGKLDASQYPEPDEVAVAVEQTMRKQCCKCFDSMARPERFDLPGMAVHQPLTGAVPGDSCPIWTHLGHSWAQETTSSLPQRR